MLLTIARCAVVTHFKGLEIKYTIFIYLYDNDTVGYYSIRVYIADGRIFLSTVEIFIKSQNSRESNIRLLRMCTGRF
jgi:hypothetical protein